MSREYKPISRAASDALHRVSTATLTSRLMKAGLRNTFLGGLGPLRPDLRLLGYARTLRYVPAREDLDMQVDYDNATNIQRLAVEAIDPEEGGSARGILWSYHCNPHHEARCCRVGNGWCAARYSQV